MRLINFVRFAALSCIVVGLQSKEPGKEITALGPRQMIAKFQGLLCNSTKLWLQLRCDSRVSIQTFGRAPRVDSRLDSSARWARATPSARAAAASSGPCGLRGPRHQASFTGPRQGQALAGKIERRRKDATEESNERTRRKEEQGGLGRYWRCSHMRGAEE